MNVEITGSLYFEFRDGLNCSQDLPGVKNNPRGKANACFPTGRIGFSPSVADGLVGLGRSGLDVYFLASAILIVAVYDPLFVWVSIT